MHAECWRSKRSKSSSDNPVRFTSLGLFLLENCAFSTAGSDLWIFDESTGSILEIKHFDYYILAPIVGDNKLFVVADL